jgi:hypothetical protein
VKYEVGQWFGAAAVGLDGPYGRQVWTLVTLRGRPKNCVNCGHTLFRVLAWSPVTNGRNRMERICLQCLPRGKEE